MRDCLFCAIVECSFARSPALPQDIRSTPNKNTHKFVEYFDVRDAERALLALNRTKVRSKMIKIEVRTCRSIGLLLLFFGLFYI